MPLQKNQLLTLRIERLSSDGSGVAHSPEGEAVFVPGTAPGDEAQVRIVKDCGRYAFGILDKLLTLRLTASRWTVLSPAPAAGAACGTWTTPPSCGPNRRASPTPSAASADWMCRCWMPFPPLRWTATATRYSSRWAATKTVRPASAFTPAAPIASSPAPIANYSPAS